MSFWVLDFIVIYIDLLSGFTVTIYLNVKRLRLRTQREFKLWASAVFHLPDLPISIKHEL